MLYLMYEFQLNKSTINNIIIYILRSKSSDG